jgi:hypothetical protein
LPHLKQRLTDLTENFGFLFDFTICAFVATFAPLKVKRKSEKLKIIFGFCDFYFLLVVFPPAMPSARPMRAGPFSILVFTFKGESHQSEQF